MQHYGRLGTPVGCRHHPEWFKDYETENGEAKFLRTGQELKNERKYNPFTLMRQKLRLRGGSNLPKVTQQPRARGWF